MHHDDRGRPIFRPKQGREEPAQQESAPRLTSQQKEIMRTAALRALDADRLRAERRRLRSRQLSPTASPDEMKTLRCDLAGLSDFEVVEVAKRTSMDCNMMPSPEAGFVPALQVILEVIRDRRLRFE